VSDIFDLGFSFLSCLFVVALERIINVPKREIGTISVKRILDAADKAKVSAFQVAQDLANGKNSYKVESVRTKRLQEFVSVILKLQALKEAVGYSQIGSIELVRDPRSR
jgi:superfamily I DNA/RNA helicase